MAALTDKQLVKIGAKYNTDRRMFFVSPSDASRVFKYLREYSANDARTLLQTGYAIRKRRLAKGQLQVDLAYDTDVPQNTLSALENGRMFCTEEMARRVAFGLRCHWTDLVTG